LGSKGFAGTARGLLDGAREGLNLLSRSDPGAASAVARHVIDRMCRLSDWIALAEQTQWEEDNAWSGGAALALERYRLEVIERASPLDRPELIELNRRLALNGAEPTAAQPAP
jgi:hypothetical protein